MKKAPEGAKSGKLGGHSTVPVGVIELAYLVSGDRKHVVGFRPERVERRIDVLIAIGNRLP